MSCSHAVPLANPSVDRPRHRFGRSLIALVATGTAVVGLGACGGSKATDSSKTTAAASSYTVVPDAEVTAGLAKVSGIMATLEARRIADEADARAGLEEMYNTWFEFEGTVRQKEKEAYLQMEDGLVSAKIGVQENRIPKIVSGIVDFEAARALYLAKHP